MGVDECVLYIFVQVSQLFYVRSSLVGWGGVGGPLELFESLKSQKCSEDMLVDSLTKHLLYLLPIHSIFRIHSPTPCPM